MRISSIYGERNNHPRRTTTYAVKLRDISGTISMILYVKRATDELTPSAYTGARSTPKLLNALRPQNA